MKRSAKKGFTLVEILIVVIILGILAAIVIPQFTQASTEARISNLRTNLQTIRSQLLLYKTQHLENYPDTDFVNQMTQYSDIAGTTTSATPSATTPFGPYLQSVPINPFSGVSDVRIVEAGDTVFSATADGGWYFNTVTGEFRADLVTSDDYETADGTAFSEL
jgi:general secretion pathway protein G